MLVDRSPLITFIQAAQPMVPERCAEIVQRFAPVQLPKGGFFLNEGKIADEYLFLTEGWMRAYTHDTDGDEVTTAFYSLGQVVFDVDSFFNRTPSKENIVALSDCSGFALTFAELNDLFHAFPEFREFGRRVLVRGFAALKQRMLAMINTTAETRYAALLRREPMIFQHVPLKHIATYLGVTDTSLSRIRKEFVKR
jgi:CRP-like cAMP-binding protein